MLTLIEKQEIRKRKTSTLLVRSNIKILGIEIRNFVSSIKLNSTLNKYLFSVIFILAFVFMTINITKINTFKYKKLNTLELHNDVVLEDLLFNYLVVKDDVMNIEVAQNNSLEYLKPVSLKDYKIKNGDAISKIAAKYKISLSTLISFNNIRDVKRIRAGATIKIPDLDGVPYKIRKGDSLGGIASKFKVRLNDILDVNNLESAIIKPGQDIFIPGVTMSKFDLKKAMGSLFVYPARGRLTSGFGYRTDPFTGLKRMHYGIDLANRVGTKIKSSMDGVVKVAGLSKLYGKYVVISHDRGFQTLYAHLNKITVKKGQRVSQGFPIGKMGNTGRSTGSHLHFSIYRNQQPINPLSQLK